MAAGKSSRINRQYKTKYRIRNWREYERGLRSREAFQDALADAGYDMWTGLMKVLAITTQLATQPTLIRARVESSRTISRFGLIQISPRCGPKLEGG